MRKSRILLVEDTPEILEANRNALIANGFDVATAESLKEAKEQINLHMPDLIVLDIMLPDGSGIDLCREIRGNIMAPILFLTVLGESEQVLGGLGAGGDDYIVKPYRVEELCARVKAQLRRTELMRRSIENPVIGPLRLDLKTQRAYLHDKDLLLTPKEYLLLTVLVRAEGRYLTAEEIYAEVWGLNAHEDVRTVIMHISRLRNKLKTGADDESVRIDRSVHMGYRLVAGDCEDC